MHFNPFGTKHQKNKGDWFNLTHIPDCKLWLDASPSPANVSNVKSGNAAQFIAANSEYLSVADNAALSMGDVDFTLAGCWYFVTAYHNTAADLIGISVNDGAFNTAANTGGVQDGTADFEIGRYNIANYFNGRAH